VAPGPAPRRKPTFAERREQRAAVEDVGEVLDFAARFLEARPRSVAEVRRRLTSAGYRAELIEAAITRLGDLRFLDDELFARTWVESRDRARPRGERALRRELAVRGVDRAIVDAVIDDRRPGPGALIGEPPVDPDEVAAERLLAKRLASLLREADPRRRRQRAYALLARNGFAPDVCSAVVRRVLDATDIDEAGE